MYGRDFMAENNLLDALDLNQFSLKELQEAAYTGVLLQRPRTKVD
jgi:opine dehydrogenase